MKKFYLSLFLTAVFVSVGCSPESEEIAPEGTGGDPTLLEAPDPEFDRRDPIRESLEHQFAEGELTYEVSEEEVRTYCDMLLETETRPYRTEAIEYESATLMYAVNFDDGQGWKLISGDKRTQPILAESDTGSFAAETLNPGEAIWLDDLAEDVYHLSAGGATPASVEEYAQTANPAWVDLAPVMPTANGLDEGEWVPIDTKTIRNVEKVGPLLQTKWDQGFPWNSCCPRTSAEAPDYDRAPAGCVAIAGAQMLYYLHYLWGVPAEMYEYGKCEGSLDTSYQFYFSDPTAGAWDKMPIKKANSYITPNSDYSAILIGFVGHEIGMNYGVEQSSSDDEKLQDLFASYDIESAYVRYDSRKIIERLNNGVPVIMRAYGDRINKFLGIWYKYFYGHCWIIDSYEAHYTTTRTTYEWYDYYQKPIPGDGDDTLPEEPDPNPNPDPDPDFIPDSLVAKADSIIDNPNHNTPRKSRKRTVFPSGKTKVVTSPRKLEGEYFTMNWGWNNCYDKRRYGIADSWRVETADKDLAYDYKRKMLVITGLSK